MQERATRARTASIRAVAEPDPRSDSGLDTFELLRRWKRFVTMQDLAETTIRQYGACLVRFLWHALKPIAECTEDDLLDWLDTFDGKGGHKGMAVRALKSFYGWAYGGDILPTNPARRLRTSKPKYGPAPYLDPDELTRLVIAAADREPRRAWAIVLMYATGIRARSAVNLMPDDVRGGRLHVRIAKGAKPYSVPLNRMAQEAAAELVELAAERMAAGTLAGGPARPETLLGVQYGRLAQWVTEAGVDADLPTSTHAHLLRHSFATRLAEKQVHPRTIQDLMNHSDMSQLTRYIAVADPSKRSAVDLLDEDF